MSTVVLTYIHTEFYGTEQFRKSCERVGLPIHNAWDQSIYNGTVGSIMYMLYKALVDLQNKYTHVIYSDGADTYFLKSFQPPEHLLISAEKACFPDPDLAKQYPRIPSSPWKFVNAGNWCGPINLAIDFFNEKSLNNYQDKHVNGQREWHHAFLQAIEEQFPVTLDYNCEFMQSVAFEDPGDFSIHIDRKLETWPKIINDTPRFINNITKTEPCVLHFNGRTDAEWIYDIYK